ncbi:MAG TPA: NAD(P)-binding domain-containing protein [Streptosporangiaceae bacterium]|jgi:predicted dinucleotide-binding enzyme|nr:NAD(P)-binding domain-containing protein [Streptosporangiaceae bacterium]
MTTIGIIGSGHVGSNLAKAAVAHGYDVVISNSTGPDSLAGLVGELGQQATAATPEQAAAAADFAIVAIPITTVGQVPVEPLAGKVVIATINYFPGRDGPIAEIDNGTTTAPGVLQAHLRASKVVRAFSMIDAADMSGDGHPEGDPKRRALALAGDDADARKLVAGLYDQFGFDTVDLGGLAESWRVDPGQAAFVTRQNLAELEANVANAKRG